MPNVQVLAVPVGKEPRQVTIESTSLADAYSLVNGGPLEMVPLTDKIYMWCNEEGKLTGLPVNFIMVGEGGSIDPVVGDVFFSTDDGNGEIDSITDEQAEFLIDMLQRTPSAR